MSPRSSTPTRRRRSSRRAVALRWLGLLVVAGVAVGYLKPLQDFRQTRNDLREQRAELAEIRQDSRRLTRELAAAETDEFVLRESRCLGSVRKGEVLFLVDVEGDCDR